MNQRREPRLAAEQAVWITLFGKMETRIPGYIRNISGRGVGLEVGQPIETGTALKVDIPDTLLLGEAIYCRQEGDRYYIGVELEHALYGLAELARTLNEFDEGRSGPKEAYAVDDAHGKHQQEAH